MQANEARLLLANLIERVQIEDDGSRRLTGTITTQEVTALEFALKKLAAELPLPSTSRTHPEGDCETSSIQEQSRHSIEPTIELNPTSERASPPPEGARICIDFGTAMSKATLIVDSTDENEEDLADERIEVLQLGIPGEQEGISNTMLISSVYLDDLGRLWFGKNAIDLSLTEEQGDSGNRSHRRLDNIKRILTEGSVEDHVPSDFNPTQSSVNFGDMVVAYLMFLMWAVNEAVREVVMELDEPPYLARRFAMPCLSSDEANEIDSLLRHYLGEAQALANIFSQVMQNGIPLAEFLSELKEVRNSNLNRSFLAESIVEPLGAANSMLSWRTDVDSLMMVVDVGAGTTDFSLVRFNVNSNKQTSSAVEVSGATQGIKQAGNFLDRSLSQLILRKAGISPGTEDHMRNQSALDLRIREYKETLFNEESVFVNLLQGDPVKVELVEFLELDAVKNFGKSLKNTMQEILDRIDESWIGWISADATRKLTVAITGGGRNLPMVQELTSNPVTVRGKLIDVAPAQVFPQWLEHSYPDLANDYPQIAVSLGGARKHHIKSKGVVVGTAGNIVERPQLEGYYVTGN